MNNSDKKQSNKKEIKLGNERENISRGPCEPGNKRCPDNFTEERSEETKLDNNIIDNRSQLPIPRPCNPGDRDCPNGDGPF